MRLSRVPSSLPPSLVKQVDQWQRLASDNANLWKKHQNQKNEIKKMERRMQEESVRNNVLIVDLSVRPGVDGLIQS